MGNYIDVKRTVWERIYLDDDCDLNKLSQELNSNDDPFNVLSDNDWVDTEILLETAELLTVEENNNQSTIEICEDGKVIWSNGKD